MAIPVRNEAARIGACLGALTAQRETAPFTVLLLLNGCTDGTAAVVRARASDLPFRLIIRQVELPPGRAHAGEARACALEAAARLLEREGYRQGVLLTTDADSRVAADWLAANRAELQAGAEAVAGCVSHDPLEAALLPPALRRRIALEDSYEALLAEVEAGLDPVPGDPWPRHRMASGASLAVRLSVYRRVGGMPRVPVGEDRAFWAALAAADIRRRHSCAARVLTTCRLDGRAAGGAADTLRRQLAEPELACDPLLEPVSLAIRRWRARAALRRLHGAGDAAGLRHWAARLRLPWRRPTDYAAQPFGALWQAAERESPVLARRSLLPAELPGQILRARTFLLDTLSHGAAGPAGSGRYAPASRSAVPAWWP